MKKSAKRPPAIINRKARFDYDLGETISAGVVLIGPEVRGARLGHVNMTGAYAALKPNGLLLYNMSISIPETAQATVDSKELSQPRKLLITKKDMDKIQSAKKQGLTVVPTRLFNQGRFIKVELALAKGKKKYDKRETIKRRQQDRDSRRLIKG